MNLLTITLGLNSKERILMQGKRGNCRSQAALVKAASALQRTAAQLFVTRLIGGEHCNLRGLDGISVLERECGSGSVP